MDERTQMMGGPTPTSMGTTRGLDRTALGMPPGGEAGRTVMGGQMRALDLEAVVGNRFAIASESSREYLLLLLKSTGGAGGRRMPINLSLVIDRSGSMEGEPLEYVKRACGYVVDLLGPEDVLSIVTFEEQVDVIMPCRRVMNKALIKEHINRIQAGNTTNLFDGIAAGCQQVTQVTQAGYLSRVVVLTDGEPTAGIKDHSSIVNMVSEQKARGVSITALGFGSDYNEELLHGIARRSGGNYYYVAQPALIPEVFRRELETLMTITARNVRVRLHTPKGVQVRYVHGAATPKFGNRTVEFQLPDIERGSVVSSLSELEFDRHVPGTYRVLRAEVAYDDTVSSRTEIVSVDAVLDFTNDAQAVAMGKNPVVQRELEVHLATRNLEKTMMGMRTRQMTAMGAVSELQRTRTMLMQAGRSGEAQEVTRAMETIQRGGEVEKTLIGTIYHLDKGARKA